MITNKKLLTLSEALERLMEQSEKKTLYISRPLVNYDEFRVWAKEQGFPTTLEPEKFHVTIAFSKTPVDWEKVKPEDHELIADDQKRTVEALGDAGAVVLRFEDRELANRWQEIVDAGASWDYDSYKPHVTISFDSGNLDLKSIVPFTGELVFGPEEFTEVDDDWKEKVDEE